MDLEQLKSLKNLISPEEIFHLMQEDGFTKEQVQTALDTISNDINESRSFQENSEMSNQIRHLRSIMNDNDICELLVSEGYETENFKPYLYECKVDMVEPKNLTVDKHTETSLPISTDVNSITMCPVSVKQDQLYKYDLYFHHSQEISHEDSYVITAVYERLERCGYKCHFNDRYNCSVAPSSLIEQSNLLSNSKVLLVFLGSSYREHIKKQKSENSKLTTDFEYIQELITINFRPIVFIKLDSSNISDSCFSELCLMNSTINDDVYLKLVDYYSSYCVDISGFKQLISASNLYNRWKENKDMDIGSNDNMLRCLLFLYKTLGLARKLLRLMNCTVSLPVAISEDVEDLITTAKN